MAVSFNAYSVLGVDSACTFDELKSAYHRLLLVYHPDKQTASSSSTSMSDSNTNNEVFLAIQRAWKMVNTAEERDKYDLLLSAGGRSIGTVEQLTIDEFVPSNDGLVLKKACRCGDYYEITQDDIAAGYNHSLMLTNTNQIYSWG